MRVAVVGGSGKVGRILVPTLLQSHEAVVVDLMEPSYSGAEFVQTDITQVEGWDAVPGVDALLFLAMPPPGRPGDLGAAVRNFDVSVSSLYLALNWAGRTGASRAVYASSLTVYSTPPGAHYPDTDAVPDSHRAYGLAKWLGEEVCRAASKEWGMTVTALRLAHPSTEEEWRGPVYPTATSPHDVTAAFLAALAHESGEYAVVPVSGDALGRYVDLVPTRELLGWEPKERSEVHRAWPVSR